MSSSQVASSGVLEVHQIRDYLAQLNEKLTFLRGSL